MAEPYSDEQLELWNASTPVQMGSALNQRWLATANRLMRERDKARRVAKVLAFGDPMFRKWTTEIDDALRAAQNYPERP
jgi:hypothetical protein